MTTAILDEPRAWRAAWDFTYWNSDDVDIQLRRARNRGVGAFLFGPKERHVTIRDGAVPVREEHLDHNLLVNAGIQRMLDLLIVAGGQGYNNANSRIGVGNDSTAAVATQTDLQAAAGSANRQFEVMDATFPSRASQTVTWRTTFPVGEANFAIAEVGLDVGTVAGTAVVTPMLARKVANLGSKSSSITLQVTYTVTVS